MLGRQYQNCGRVGDDVASFRQAIALASENAEAHYDLGNSLLIAGETGEAIIVLRKAIDLHPDFAEAHDALARALWQQGHFEKATEHFRRAIQLKPERAALHCNLGSALHQQGQLDKAIECYRRAVALDSTSATAYSNLGNALRETRQLDEALACCRRAIEIRPDFVGAHNNLGNALRDLGQTDQKSTIEAVECYRRVLLAEPNYAEAHNNLGIALLDLGNPSEAIECFRRALSLKPSYYEAHCNLAKAFRGLGGLEQAAECYKRALELKPDYAEAHSSLADTLMGLGNLAQAAVCYQRALQMKPDFAEAHLGLGMLLLRQGDFRQGWREYQWRWKTSQSAFIDRGFQQPEWNGRELAGETVLIYAEQGFGDTIQFVRYAPLVKARGARVLIQCQVGLTRMLSSAEGIDEVITWGQALPPFDERVAMMSLPRIFDTSLETIPAKEEYLAADPALVAKWRPALGTDNRFKVGIAWQCNAGNDPAPCRSFPVTHFLALARLAGVSLYSLQKGPASAELEKQRDVLPVIDLTGEIADFADTAAIMSQLDLVISCDKSVAHLAGALGIPTWVALPYSAPWRWLCERADSPWYPTMRLFRQQRAGDWDELFQRISQTLVELIGKRQSRQGSRSDACTILMPRSELVETAEPEAPPGGIAEAKEAAIDEEHADCLGAHEPEEGDAKAHYNVGNALASQGKYDHAVPRYRRALALNPYFAKAHHNLGSALSKQEEWAQAAACYRQALALESDYAAAHYNLGVVLQTQGKLDEAVSCYRRVLQLKPDHAEAHYSLGAALQAQDKVDEAVPCYRRALELEPDRAEAHRNLGYVLTRQGLCDEAVTCYRRALALKPDYTIAIHNLANALQGQGKFNDAVPHYQRVLELEPDNAEVHYCLGYALALMDESDLEEAVACYRRAIDLKPGLIQARNNLGSALTLLGKVDEALTCFGLTLQLDPANADAHWKQSFLRLLQGNFERGWPEFEWRWRTNMKQFASRGFQRPLWHGQPFSGKTLLLHAEQGFGDTIQFIRYARQVQARGGTVIVECQVGLERLLKSCSGIDLILSRGQPLPSFDFQSPLLSLPGIIGTKMETIPVDIPYLSADRELAEQWQNKLLQRGEFKIGINWRGNPLHLGDRRRSFPLSCFASLARVPGVRLFSLQKGPGSTDLTACDDRFVVTDLSEQITDFADTAAIMSHLDLVISCDSAPAHLAGALGLPVWVALPFAPDWRWLLEREDSPWYPTMRLFRQRKAGDWDDVFQRIARSLEECIGSARRRDDRRQDNHAVPVVVSKRAEPAGLKTPTPSIAEDAGIKIDAEHSRKHRALETNLNDAAAHYNCGNALASQGKLDEAVACYRRALEIKPDFVKAHHNLGSALTKQGQFAEAVACFQRALELKPDYTGARYNLGTALQEQGKLEEAVACYHQALKFEPDHVEALNRLGTALQRQGKLSEAVACYEGVLQLRPDHAIAHNNLGAALQQQGNLGAAALHYQRALKLKPGYAGAHWNQSLLHILQGDFKRGWAGYGWRWRTKMPEFVSRGFQQPRWDGQPFDGKTILLHGEQGLGDTIQFIRYASLVKARGATIIVECPPELVRLLKSCSGINAIADRGEVLPSFDIQIPLLSLPAIFGTTLETIPAEIPYLSAESGDLEQWRIKLPDDGYFKIGIAWQGSPLHSGDRFRSFPLNCFASLARVPGVRLYSLQKGPGSADLKACGDQLPVTDLSEQIADFADTAAIMSQLDLVISCDSAPAHLAGALGRPVWVALPLTPDWRWMLQREDSPWYPIMRLFRQRQAGDWDEVFQQIARALAECIDSRQLKHDRAWNVQAIPALNSQNAETVAKTQPVRVNDLLAEATALHRAGQLQHAERAYRQILELCPDHPDALHHLGLAAHQAGQHDTAAELIIRAIHVKPGAAAFHSSLGLVYLAQDEIDAALTCYRRALELKPDYVEAHHNLGNALSAQGKFDEAAKCYRRALELNPNDIGAHNCLGNTLTKIAKLDEAVACFRRVLELQPDYAAAHSNLSVALLDQGKLDEAVSCCGRALELRPDYPHAHHNLGIALAAQGKFDEAIASYSRALELKPDYANARWNRSLLHLLKGDFEHGWPEYEWRWRTKMPQFVNRDFRQPRWDGQPLEGKTILLHSEQGFGDTIQFIRFARQVKARGGTVILECQPELARLLGCCSGIDAVVCTGQQHPGFDAQVPLLSLPGIFDTAVETIPAEIPYLRADNGLVEQWQAKMAGRGDFKIGIIWRGNPGHPGDRTRSFPLGCFASLAQITGVRLYSLQKGSASVELKAYGDQMRVTDLSEQITDFADTAAIMSQLDLVISCDSAPAHLAGALGRPVWVALPFVPDWRWMLDREDSPWYPSMRLFRQQQSGDWGEVFAWMAVALRELVDGRSIVRDRHQDSRPIPVHHPKDADTANQTALGPKQGSGEAQFNQGVALAAQGKIDEAVACYRRALELIPNFAAALHNLGNALQRQGKFDEAVTCYRRALELKPDCAVIYYCLGNALELQEQRNLEEAVACYRSALEIKPDFVKAHYNLGFALMRQGKVDEAIGCYGRAVQLEPDYADAHWNRSWLHLLKGDFELGWPGYEWRWRTRKPQSADRGFQQPRWDGIPFEGKTIVVHAEQGLGDTIQFIRYASQVKARGGTVVLECQPELIRLLKSYSGIDALVGRGAVLPSFDAHVPLLSLPGVFGTTVETIPTEVPYLRADSNLVEQWRTKLPVGDNLKIGITWRGSPSHTNDRFRSFPLSCFAALARVRGVRLYSLQKGPAGDDMKACGDQLPVTDLSEQINDFADTAAIMSQLDLVISCDSSPAHLAGALGVPVWVALPFAPDWRWLLERDDSPWYPSMRLFRQRKAGDWDEVFQRIARALEELIGGGRLHDGRRQNYHAIPVVDSQRADPAGLNTPPPSIAEDAGIKIDAEQSRQRRALETNLNDGAAHYNFGNALASQGKLDESVACYRRALEIKPDFAKAHHNLGAALTRQGRLDEAVACFQRALELKPNYAGARYNLGIALQKQGQLDEAVACFREALALGPNCAEAHNSLGSALTKQGCFHEAVACHQRALELKPDDADTHHNLGNAWSEQSKFGEAVACYRRAIVLQPDHADAHSNLGAALQAQGKLDEALACYQAALEIKPGHADAHNNLGHAWQEQGKWSEAAACYRRALELQPDHGQAHWNQSLLYLLQGDFESGFSGYEWRWRTKMKRFVGRAFQQSRWDGRPLDGKTILLHAEQGFGDTIQFIRYASRVKAQGGTVIAECQPELIRLLRSCSGIDAIFGRGAVLPSFDAHVPLLSLPGIFGTTVETIPTEVPYLRADSNLVEQWRIKLPVGDNLKIGITWGGSPSHAGDRFRSFPLSCFGALARVRGVCLYSLQKGSVGAELKACGDQLPVTDLSEQINDFADTAAIMSQLDLVISCDSSPAHLAGALGVPVWVALPFAPDWRWLLERDDSPWYPTMRLFRQQKAGDWDEVFQRIARALEELIGGDSLSRLRRRNSVSISLPSSQLAEAANGESSLASIAEALTQATALHSNGQLHHAEQIYRQILQLNPDHPDALHQLGLAAHQVGRQEIAADLIIRAIRANPNDAAFHSNLGLVHQAQGNLEEAEACCRRALELKSDYTEAQHNLGNALYAQGKSHQAVACYRRAVKLKPGFVDAHYCLGNALMKRGQLGEAMVCYRRAIELDADNASAHWNQSFLYLIQGDFTRGWPEYEWRWRTKAKQFASRGFQQPLWDGHSLECKTILLHAEQGLGDTIQFIRYAPLVKARGGTVVVECQPELTKLLTPCLGIDAIYGRGQTLPRFDVQAPLLSLPRIFGTTMDTFPAEIPYLKADAELVERWQKTSPTVGEFKIGIAWAGNPLHRGDRMRSVPLRFFSSLGRIGGVRLYSLQKGPASAELRTCEFPVTDLSEQITDFGDTAAIMSHLDLVISCDTAVAHLAGALGRPVWVALPFAPDWRWLLEREDSPWYPTMRLFRQQRPGDWGELFARMAATLRELVDGRSIVRDRHQNSRPIPIFNSDGAETAHQTVPRLKQGSAEAQYNQGIDLAAKGNVDEAVACYRRALELKPNFAAALHNLGSALQKQGKSDEAMVCHRRALEIEPENEIVYYCLGNALALQEQRNLEEAVACYRSALEIKPDFAKAHHNLGSALTMQGKVDEAISCYGRALQRVPEYAEAHWNRSLLHLLKGDFELGWPGYEWRWRTKMPQFMNRDFRQPRWEGKPFEGKTIVLHAEQGFGDTIQFIRYASQVKARGGTVILECQPELIRLLKSYSGIGAICGRGAVLPSFDAHVPLLSLPGIFGTTVETIPTEVPYLRADSNLVEQWRTKLPVGDNLKIGITWGGSPSHAGDRFRSFPLSCFGALARVRGVRLYSLQKGPVGAELKACGDQMRVTDLSEQITDFADTAAIMSQLDLVISCDSSPAHLAGALGVPVWVALPFAPDWRWMLEREDSPWYPTMRLFRQQKAGDWDEVFRRIAQALEALIGSGR